jgi:hypothetical protein
VSRDQYRLLPKVSSSLARPGDLIFWATDPANPATIHHVAIFLGGGMMIDSPRTGTVVRVRPVYTRGVMRHVARPGGARVTALLPVERGSRGDDVRALQLRLRANGFAVPVTGWYGPMTYTAVRTFQRRTGVSATGLVGPSTWAHLVVNGVQVRPS